MNQKQAKIVLILMTVILFLIFSLIYLQAISIEHFSNNNLVSSNSQTLPVAKIPSTQQHTLPGLSMGLSPYNVSLPSRQPQTADIGNNSRSSGNLGQGSQGVFSSPINSSFPTDRFVMIHDTILDDYDITNPVLTPDDIIYQTTKYQALREKGHFGNFGNYAPSFGKPSPSFRAPSFGKPAPAPAPAPAKPITFPCTVVVSYSNYKDKNSGLDPFLNKTMSVQDYDRFFAAYPIKDATGNTMYFPGIDGMYSLWALSVSNNSIICGWHQYASDKAPANNYPNKLVLYVKNVL